MRFRPRCRAPAPSRTPRAAARSSRARTSRPRRRWRRHRARRRASNPAPARGRSGAPRSEALPSGSRCSLRPGVPRDDRLGRRPRPVARAVLDDHPPAGQARLTGERVREPRQRVGLVPGRGDDRVRQAHIRVSSRSTRVTRADQFVRDARVSAVGGGGPKGGGRRPTSVASAARALARPAGSKPQYTDRRP